MKLVGPVTKAHAAERMPQVNMIRAIHRGPDALKDQVTWNLKDKVAKEEYAGPQAVCEGAEPKILVHRQRRHGNIRAIEIGDAIGDQNQRQNAPGDLLDQSRFKCLRHVVLLKTGSDKWSGSAVWAIYARSGKLIAAV